jgi:hypothetical protein
MVAIGAGAGCGAGTGAGMGVGMGTGTGSSAGGSIASTGVPLINAAGCCSAFGVAGTTDTCSFVGIKSIPISGRRSGMGSSGAEVPGNSHSSNSTLSL